MTQHSLITQTPAKSGALQTCISLMTVMRIVGQEVPTRLSRGQNFGCQR